jgi:hypothetical protein
MAVREQARGLNVLDRDRQHDGEVGQQPERRVEVGEPADGQVRVEQLLRRTSAEVASVPGGRERRRSRTTARSGCGRPTAYIATFVSTKITGSPYASSGMS